MSFQNTASSFLMINPYCTPFINSIFFFKVLVCIHFALQVYMYTVVHGYNMIEPYSRFIIPRYVCTVSMVKHSVIICDWILENRP